MRKLFVIWLLFIIISLTGCSNAHEANGSKDNRQPLTRAQIDEIIAAANESVIVDVDYSQVSKLDPAQQTKINEQMSYLGQNLKGKVTLENKDIVVARVNGENITAADWYLEKIKRIVQVKYKNKSVPPSAEIFNALIEDKVISSTARSLGIYPPEEQVKAYIEDQRKYMENLNPEEITVLIDAWDISERNISH